MLLQVKLRQEVRRFIVWDKGGLLLPIHTDVNTETLVAYVIFYKHPNCTLPALE